MESENQRVISGDEFIQAAERGDLATVTLYHTRGGDLMYRKRHEDFGPFGSFDIANTTALHQAAAYNKVDVIAYLVDHGVPVNITTQEGWTPLHAATLKGKRDAAQELLRRGADFTIEDAQGYSPEDGARNTGRTEILRDIQRERERRVQPQATTTQQAAPFAELRFNLLGREVNLTSWANTVQSYITAAQSLLTSTRQNVRQHAQTARNLRTAVEQGVASTLATPSGIATASSLSSVLPTINTYLPSLQTASAPSAAEVRRAREQAFSATSTSATTTTETAPSEVTQPSRGEKRARSDSDSDSDNNSEKRARGDRTPPSP